MSQTKAQLIQPVGIFTAPRVNVSGVLTASSFSGNLTGSAAGLAGTPNITAGVITATSFYGSGANLTGIAAAPYVGQTTTSQSPTTTIDLSRGNVVYFNHSVDTTVAFANTSTTMEVRFIRAKDDTLTPRSITWPSSIIWDNATIPTLGISSSPSDAQIFNLTTRDAGTTWYAYEEFTFQPNSTLLAWGSNVVSGVFLKGQLGQNNVINYSSPVQIPGTTWSFVSSGSEHTLALKMDGTLWSWGYNFYGEMGQNNNITPLSASSPVQIPGTTWRSISTGIQHSLAIKTDNTLWAWGNNQSSQLGLNNVSPASSPIQIPGTTWNSASAGYLHSFAIKTDGTLWAWGRNSYGELGQNNRAYYSSPVQIPGTTWKYANGSGRDYTLATKTDGTLWAWGYNGNYLLGQGNTIDRSSPVQIPGTTWNSIAGNNFSAALSTKTDGTLWSWGVNGAGQLGQNNTSPASSPIQIPGTTWSSISSGYQHSLATKTDGTLWAWGINDEGQLGLNNTVRYSSPVQIPGTKWSVSSISTFSRSSFAIREIP